MHTWQVAVYGLVLVGWLVSPPTVAEQPNDVSPDQRRGSGNLAPQYARVMESDQ